MNTQAIKIIDEMITDYFKSYENAQEEFVRIAFWNRIKSLEQARDKISSLPSLDIDSLQRYDEATNE